MKLTFSLKQVAGPSYEQQTEHKPQTPRNSSNRQSQARSNERNLEDAIHVRSPTASTITSFEEDDHDRDLPTSCAGSQLLEQPLPKGVDSKKVVNRIYPQF